MTEDKDLELEKRMEDIRAIREMLAESRDVSLIFPWAFLVWSALVAAGTIVHYVAEARGGLDAHRALVTIWLPVILLGAVAESVSFALKAGKGAVPVFSRRLGGSILGGLSSVVILTMVVIHLALSGAMTPGLAVLIGSFPVVFYAQISYASLFIEALAGIAVGILLDFSGARGAPAFLAGGLFAAALYAVCGFHILALERPRRA